jgi:hypothetical protein
MPIFQSESHGLVGPEKMPGRVIDETFDQFVGVLPITDPEKHVYGPHQANADRERLLCALGLADRISCSFNGAIGLPRQPKAPCKGYQRDDPVIIAQALHVDLQATGIMGHGALALRDSFLLISDQVIGDPEHPLRGTDRASIVQRLGNHHTALAHHKRSAVVADAGEIDMKLPQQP